MEFFSSTISKEAITYATKVLKSSFISAGNVSINFEKQLSKKIGLINPVTVNSGTSALHLSLNLAGIGKGDEVILPAQTFIASGLSILMAGAKPIFADIEISTGNIDTKSIVKKISKKTKAIMPVHWAGYPCNMDEILKIAKKHKLVVIEDAAHAFGAKYKNKPIGSISDFTAFSFQAIKHLTTGDGGVICCKKKNNYNEAKKKRWFGIDRENSKQSYLGERIFDVSSLSFKYHLNDIAAAIGIGNLEVYKKKQKKIQHIASIYNQELKKISGLNLLDYKKDRKSSYWLFTILVDERKNFINKMQSNKIPVSVVHQRIDRFKIFKGIKKDLNNQKFFNEKQISIPIHSKLLNKDVVKIVKTIKSGW